ncbi:hypothetical protein COY24_00145 [Candidatus Uhrbacteria bacterium CG_4_10_14_0_2_um_filter_41_21]|nr:MAG: hypothetical protein COZ45_03265 [Candidatus Uhrbacteria bacterium CG_4_10_14_3_um_filter_41_21]PIZ55496.1 MAG: hypothetical protein COY24_00145 [Candidatus Uhrbacteria bacterium CG_4_10_14_0_2_um_filter_41_21]
MNVRAEGAVERILNNTAEAAQSEVTEVQVEETLEKTDFPNNREGREIGAELGRDIFNSGRDVIASTIDSIRDKLTTKNGKPRGGIFSAIGSVIKLGRDSADAVYGINFGDGTRQEGIVDIPRMAKEKAIQTREAIANKVIEVVGSLGQISTDLYKKHQKSQARFIVEAMIDANIAGVAGAETKTKENKKIKAEEGREQTEYSLQEAAEDAEMTEKFRQERYNEKSADDKWKEWENHLQEIGAMKNGKIDRDMVKDKPLNDLQIQHLEKRAVQKTIDSIKGLPPITEIPDKSVYSERAEAQETRRVEAEKLKKENNTFMDQMAEFFGWDSQEDRED